MPELMAWLDPDIGGWGGGRWAADAPFPYVPQSLPAGLAQATFLTGPERRWIQLQQAKGAKNQGHGGWGAGKSGGGNGGSGAGTEAEAFSDCTLFKEAFSNWRVWYISIMVGCPDPV